MFPGKRIKCRCGAKVFRIQLLGPTKYKIFCNKCAKEVMTIMETPEEWKRSREELKWKK